MPFPHSSSNEATTSLHTVTSLRQQLDDLGEAKFKALYPSAALVGVAGQGPSQNEFVTKYEEGPARSGIRAKAQAEVCFVKKRAGAAFAHQIGVGRAPNTDICIRRDRVSKYHAFFRQNEDDTFDVADAGSKNGTALNGQRLEPKIPTRIDVGASVSFGGEVFVFYSPDALVDYLRRP